MPARTSLAVAVKQSAPKPHLAEFVRACGATIEALNKAVQEITHAMAMLRWDRVSLSEDTEATWWLAAGAADDALRYVSLAFHRTVDESQHGKPKAKNIKSLPEKAEVAHAE